ncbi:hypothetical protein AN958_02732 [Leucoagaricus sp. SymC.cos]|nr:hypothetical protein AN958_02732 [Leucoagaricus sp. SymC.cos]
MYYCETKKGHLEDKRVEADLKFIALSTGPKATKLCGRVQWQRSCVAVLEHLRESIVSRQKPHRPRVKRSGTRRNEGTSVVKAMPDDWSPWFEQF